MLVIINNYRYTKNEGSKFNLNNLVKYLSDKKIKHCFVKTHSQFDKCIKNNNVKGLILTGSAAPRAVRKQSILSCKAIMVLTRSAYSFWFLNLLVFCMSLSISWPS